MVSAILKSLGVMSFVTFMLIALVIVICDLYASDIINYVSNNLNPDASDSDREEVRQSRITELIKVERMRQAIHSHDGVLGLGNYAIVKMVLMVGSFIGIIFYVFGSMV